MAYPNDDSEFIRPSYVLTDLSDSSSATVASKGTPVAYVNEKQGREHIVYRGVDNKIHMLSREDEAVGHWQSECLHDSAGLRELAELAATDPVAYFYESERSDHVVFVANDGSVRELHRQPSGKWGNARLAENFHETQFQGPFVGYALDARGDQHIVGAAKDERIYELVWSLRSVQGSITIPNPNLPFLPTIEVPAPWREQRLFSEVNYFEQPNRPPIAGRPASLLGEKPTRQHIFYRSPNGQLHELRWKDDRKAPRTWKLLPVSGLPELLPARGDPVARTLESGAVHVLVYVGPDGILHRIQRDGIDEGVWSHEAADGKDVARASKSYELASYVLKGVQHVIYRDGDSALHECVFGKGRPWSHRLPVARWSHHSPTAYAVPLRRAAVIVFCDERGSVCELRREPTDVFISHTSEDKGGYAIPLARALREQGLTVWLDNDQLKLGDSFAERVRSALADARYAVALLTPRSLDKEWPKRERDWLVELDRENGGKILPVLADLSVDGVPPDLRHLLVGHWTEGCETLAHNIHRRIKAR